MNLIHEFRKRVDVARALAISFALTPHDHWSRARIEARQQAMLTRLVRHAAAHSPFYRELYGGIDISGKVALHDLPPIDKPMVMANFDRLVTDRRLTLATVETHLRGLRREGYLFGRYRALATAGSSGYRGIFVFSRKEWSVELANALRWHRYMGITPRLFPRVKISAIGADSPMHVSACLTGSGDVGLFRFQILAAISPLAELVAALNAFQPDVLLSYPSVASLLALEQLSGRLRIAPTRISTHSELLSAEMASRIERAWGCKPFNHYGLSELSTVAVECDRHRGLHLLDDMFILEVVEDRFRPVPPGRLGQRLLLTNLYNYTQPLIRYDVSDMLEISAESCTCGRGFPLVAAIGGRAEEVVEFPGERGGRVAVPTVVFASIIEDFSEIAEFQICHEDGELLVRAVFASPREGLEKELEARLAARLRQMGAVPPPVRIERAAALERGSAGMGKLKIVATEAVLRAAAGATIVLPGERPEGAVHA